MSSTKTTSPTLTSPPVERQLAILYERRLALENLIQSLERYNQAIGAGIPAAAETRLATSPARQVAC